MLIDWNEVDDKHAAWDKSVITNITSIDDADWALVAAERELLDQPIPHGRTNELWGWQLMKFISETSIMTFHFSPIQEEISVNNGEWSPNQGFEFSTVMMIVLLFLILYY